MAILYITELFDLGKSHSAGAGQMAKLPAVAEQTLAIGGASVQSSALNGNTRFVRLMSDSVCAVAFGTNPTAATAGGTGTALGTMRLAANVPEYVEVSGPTPRLIAAIATT